MIYIEPEHRLTISLTNDTSSNDISTFIQIITKCNNETKKAGFRNLFTPEEKNVINALYSNLGIQESNKGEIKNIPGDKVKIED